MEQQPKRKAEDTALSSDSKRPKMKKQWRTPRQGDRGGVPAQMQAIQPGDSGIWVTCEMGREGKCIGEVSDLLNDYADEHYLPTSGEDGQGEAAASDDIEKEIQAEVAGIRRPTQARLFTPVKINIQCVIFFKTIAPVEPVSLVKALCENAMSNNSRKRTRFTKRLSPMTLMGRASEEGLEKVALDVLAPHFHQGPFRKRKFAIRPSLRNHNVLKRDTIIKQVASLVGPGHEVDLKNYELLILVEVFQNVCGVSVVDDSFERLKRYNIMEIYDPTPKPPMEDVKPDQVKAETDAPVLPGPSTVKKKPMDDAEDVKPDLAMAEADAPVLPGASPNAS